MKEKTLGELRKLSEEFREELVSLQADAEAIDLSIDSIRGRLVDLHAELFRRLGEDFVPSPEHVRPTRAPAYHGCPGCSRAVAADSFGRLVDHKVDLVEKNVICNGSGFNVLTGEKGGNYRD